MNISMNTNIKTFTENHIVSDFLNNAPFAAYTIARESRKIEEVKTYIKEVLIETKIKVNTIIKKEIAGKITPAMLEELKNYSKDFIQNEVEKMVRNLYHQQVSLVFAKDIENIKKFEPNFEQELIDCMVTSLNENIPGLEVSLFKL